MKIIIKKAAQLLAATALSCSALAQTQIENVEGAWLGAMAIPNGPTLTIGIEVFQKADGAWGGNVASLDQGVRYMPVSAVTVESDTFTLTLAGAPISVVGDVSQDQQSIDADFNQGNSTFKLMLNKVAALPEIDRPQFPTNTQGYLDQEVNYHNQRDNVWLSGTLTLPAGNEKHPAIMLIAGSGPNQRDSYFGGHRPFAVMADYLTRQGYIVLRSDKRGVYKSSGSFQAATLADLVRDTEAAVTFLKAHPRVDANNIILIGHSEGSLVSVMTAAEQSIQGLVSLAGPGMSVLDILLLQDQTEPAAKGATKAETDILLGFSQRFYQMILNTPSGEARKQKALALYDRLEGVEADVVSRWVNTNSGTLSIGAAQSDALYELLQQNPLPYWQAFTGEALVLNGSKDSQVPAQPNIDGILAAVTPQRARVESDILDGLNHMFQTAETGANDEYASIDETISPEVLARIGRWLKANF